jgi:hypothetical protein
MTASPIVFDGTIIPDRLVQEGLDYLSVEMETDAMVTTISPVPSSTAVRIGRVPLQDKRSHYVTSTRVRARIGKLCCAGRRSKGTDGIYHRR